MSPSPKVRPTLVVLTPQNGTYQNPGMGVLLHLPALGSHTDKCIMLIQSLVGLYHNCLHVILIVHPNHYL